MTQKPKKCITKDNAKKLQKNYVDIIEKILKKELGKQEARDFWWSVEEVEEYIAYVKAEAAKKGYENLGLRFFMGKYDDGTKNGQTTMFMAPTKRTDSVSLKSTEPGTGEDETIEDIDPYNDGYGKIPPTDY
ncbi:hypothetical protein [Zhouia amylolytica]|uniref:Uncharacterized protein n=1 Tax=Zhouia amylolytica AD3 TaxID=1286632 RepID=W2UQA7_9FLAO|nr:hypothetical protein [Zhouia amylolytica]ETN95681.1 hypothetical protein P278_14030 [Zhouia amylolytica AD3]